MTVPVLWITGTIGSGKTTVLGEASALLDEAGIPHAAVDRDALNELRPRPADDYFNDRVGLKNLACVWENYRAAGAQRLLISQVVYDWARVDDVRHALDADPILVRLVAPVEVLLERTGAREFGSAREWHLRRIHELEALQATTPVADHEVLNDGSRDVRDVALDVLRAARWLPA